MANLGAAAIEIFKWVGLLNGDGTFNFDWFIETQPDNTFGNLRRNRDSLNNIIDYLNNKDAEDNNKVEKIFSEYYWMPFFDGMGLAWKNKNAPNARDDTSDEGNSLPIGLAGKLKFSKNPDIFLSFFCGLLQINKENSLEVAPGDTFFSGNIPVPKFLSSCQLSGMPISWLGSDSPDFSITIKDKKDSSTNKQEISKVLSFKPKTPSPHLAWDVIRLITFILCSWVRFGENKDSNIMKRIRNHLFPMFGEAPDGTSPPQPISKFPLFQDMGDNPSFDVWASSVLNTDNEKPLIFLWHLKSLITGDESSTYSPGSYYFCLDKSPGNLSWNPSGAIPKFEKGNSITEGSWIGIETVKKSDDDDKESVQLVFAIATNADNKLLKLPLVEVNSDKTLNRPNTVIDINKFKEAASKQGYSRDLLDNTKIKIKKISEGGITLEISLFLQEGKKVGYSFSVNNNNNIAVEFKLPCDGLFSIKFNENAVAINAGTLSNQALLSGLFGWIANLANINDDLKNVILQLGTLLAKILTNNNEINDNYVELFKAIFTLAGSNINLNNIPIPINQTNSPLTLRLGDGDKLTDIGVNLDLKKILDGFGASFPIKMGGLSVKQKIPITNTNTSGTTTITISDLRLGNIANTKGGNSFASKLFPDMKDIPGFGLVIDMNNGGITNLSGGGKIPIQEKVGPVSINALIVDVDENHIRLDLDSYFLLGPITVVPYGLGISIDLSENKITQKLDGLAISMNTGGIILEGLLVDNKGDFIGGASISLFGLNGISAFGGYSEIENEASLFIFAALNAPLGGPPWCFVTGIAGGLGYNRKLPALTPNIDDHIFIKALGGKIIDPKKPASLDFPKLKNNYWLAAGIKFRSFGFIEGKLIATVNLGSAFTIGIMGSAKFEIAKIVSFGLNFAASASSNQFILTAGVSPDSYILYPDFARLTGQFGMGVWYGDSSQAGDFFFSIGGFHPDLPKPSHYPSLERIGISAQLYGWVNVKGEAFFACTPKNLAMGGRLSMSAGFEGISAGFDVYADVYMIYDPFFLRAEVGTCVWFNFCGRHELSVTLILWTPPFGGIATVSVDCFFFDIEFDINFGSSLETGNALYIKDFLTKYLGVTVTENNVLALTTDTNNLGLLSLDVIKGKTKPENSKVPEVKGQEGLNSHILVNPEFTLVVKTHLPLKEAALTSVNASTIKLKGKVDLRLCRESDLESLLSITLSNNSEISLKPILLNNKFPVVLFGQFNVNGYDKYEKVTVEATEGIKLDFPPTRVPEAAKDWHMVELEETSDCPDPANSDATCYPIPLSDSAITHWGNTWPNGSTAITSFRSVTRSALRKVKTVTASLPPPITLPIIRFTPQEYTVDVLRPAKNQVMGSTIIRVGILRIPVPNSTQRHPALQGIVLNIVAPKPVTPSVPSVTPNTPAKFILRSIFRAKPVLRKLPDIILRGLPNTNRKASVTLGTGKAVNLVLNPKQPINGTIQVQPVDAGQWTRIICLTAYAKPTGDFYVQGAKSFPVPPRTRRVVMLGEGNSVPVGIGGTNLSRTIGVEMDTVLLGLGHDSFAAYGCIMEALSGYAEKVEALDSVPAQDVLRAARQFRFSFPALPVGCSLILKYQARSGDNTPANTAIRWQAANANLGQAQTINSRQGQALVFDIASSQQPWQLDITINQPEWRLEGVACMNLNAQQAMSRLNHGLTWDLIDDSWWSETITTTEVTVEVKA